LELQAQPQHPWCDQHGSSSACYQLTHSINAIGPALHRSGRTSMVLAACCVGLVQARLLLHGEQLR
jgi:hypothetical protein